jgi:phage terminase small subunit
MAKTYVIDPSVLVPQDYELGPAMRKLNERQRAFVFAMLQFGTKNNTRAAIAAGYKENPNDSNAICVTAYWLAHHPGVQEAIMEEAEKRLKAGAIMAVNHLLEIADDTSADKKDRLKAVEMILNRSGLHAKTEHKVAVTHTDATSDEMIKRIELLAGNLGLDAKKLLGNCVDAEYVEVPPEDDLSDLLGV